MQPFNHALGPKVVPAVAAAPSALQHRLFGDARHLSAHALGTVGQLPVLPVVSQYADGSPYYEGCVYPCSRKTAVSCFRRLGYI
jgi:hypothetical protein